MIILNARLISYGLLQLRGQLEVSLFAVPIEKALQNPSLSEAQKQKLKLIPKIREFAFEELGLIPNDNYTTFFLQDDNTKMWVVSACEKFSFTPYDWSFPIVGTFPYKGYFQKSAAEKEIKRLQQLELDTRLGTAGGWSTLGWFNDPVLSGMLNRNEGSLAEVIIHELTHGSVFVKDSVDYNENLATFIGEKGAIIFLTSFYPDDSTLLNNYLHGESDYKKFADHMLRGAVALEELYESFADDIIDTEKQSRKEELISRIVLEIDTLNLYDRARYTKNIREGRQLNNADFMSYKRYRERQGGFEALLQDQFHGDLRKMVAWLIQKHPA